MVSTSQASRNGLCCSRQRYGVVLVRFSMAIAAVAMGISGPGMSARAAPPPRDVVRYRDFGAKGDGKTDMGRGQGHGRSSRF